MPTEHPGEITQLLLAARHGDREAEERLAALLLPELEKIASIILSREYRGHSLETGDLVNAVYLKLRPGLKSYNDSVHFKAYAATAMHKLLIDNARRKITRAKRLGQQVPLEAAERVALGDDSEEAMLRALELARLSDALAELGKLDARAAEVVILKTGGLTNQEIADNLTISLATVKRDWQAARAFLLGRLGAAGTITD